MPTVRQLPANLDLECIAGDPLSITVTASGVSTVASPVVTMTTSAGDAYTTDPGVPTASQAALVTTVAWSAADTAALNATTRDRAYKWSLSATVDGVGPVQIVAGTLRVKPVGSSGGSTASAASLAVTLGGVAVSLAVALGGGGGGASALDDLTDVAITSPSSGQVLKYNGTAWINDADATGGGGSLVVQEGDVTVVSAASTLDFGAGFDVTESPAGEANIALDLTEYAGGALPVTGGGTGSTSASAARTALGLGGAATLNVGTTASTVAAGDDSRIVGAVQTTRTISTTAPLSGGGDLSTNRTLSVASASDTAQGVVELATTAETTTGTDATRAVTPAGLLNATTASNINARVAVENNGTLVGTRRTLNFIQGSNVTLTIADDPANEEVDVTIAASGGGGVESLRLVTSVNHAPFMQAAPTIAQSSSPAQVATWYLYRVDRTLTLASLNCQCSTLEVGSTARLGIYSISAWTSDALTATLLADYGTVSGDTTGAKTASGSTVLSAGWYAACVWTSNHSTVRWFLPNANNYQSPPVLGWSTAFNLPFVGWTATAVNYSAGLPTNPPSVTLAVSGGGRTGLWAVFS